MKTVLLFEKRPHKFLSVLLGEKWAGEVPHILEGKSSLTFLTATLPIK